MTPEDRRLLSRAFDLAARGIGATSPNPAVGAIVLNGGAIVGTGYHRRAGEDHAETVALAEAGAKTRGGTLYVNLEPCSSLRLLQGRAKPCVDQILAAGIARVVAAARDPNPAIDGRGLQRLLDAGVVVEPIDPVFARRAARFNECFFSAIVTGRPFVVLKAGMTLDGRIALPDGTSRWITDEEARADARALRARCDAILVGIGTVLADDPGLLADPEGGVRASPPIRVVLDGQARVPLRSRLLTTIAQAPLRIYTSDGADTARCEALEAAGATVVRAGAERVDLDLVLEDLGRSGICSLLVEGGGEVLGAFLRARRVDKVRLYVAPRLLGGADSVPAFGGKAPDDLASSLDLDEVAIARVGETFVLSGYPRPARASLPGLPGRPGHEAPAPESS